MAVIKNLLALAALVAVGALLYPKLFPTVIEVPKIEDKWFGKGPRGKDSEAITNFSINMSEQVLQDLNKRLEIARFVQPISGTQFNYGFQAEYLKTVVDYWRTKFDWRKQELVLNKYDHYKTQISGINVHFIHVKPTKPVKTIIAIMLIHGWPSSVWEYYKAIPLLIEPFNDVAFEVVVPSIPGYGFSDAPQQEGFDVTQTARIFVQLMKRLKHDRFISHGGNWGAAVSRTIAVLYPESLRGLHLNMNYLPMGGIGGMNAVKMMIGGYLPSLVFDEPEVEYEKLYPQWDNLKFLLREFGYSHLQATKPDTIGAALVDSPVGLAAYILEKFSTWTNRDNVNKDDGGLTEKFTLDELLTNIMIYWTSNNIASSMRYYREYCYNMTVQLQLDQFVVEESVPTAICDFPQELMHFSQTLSKDKYKNLVQFTDMPRGGHFAALEEPKLVCDNIRSFAEKILDYEQEVANKPKTK